MKKYNTYRQVEEILDKYSINNYNINSDLSVDVFGDVDLSGLELCKIPIQFQNVYGKFDVSNNYLTSFEGSPGYCESFIGYDNHVVSPDHITPLAKTTNCSNNLIIDFSIYYSTKYIVCLNNPGLEQDPIKSFYDKISDSKYDWNRDVILEELKNKYPGKFKDEILELV